MTSKNAGKMRKVLRVAKSRILEPLVLDILRDLIDNQIARDNKKDIDADKSATKPGQADVRSNNRKNRNRAQAIDKWSVNSNFVN